jgi:DNA-binding response OmpR family regulator
MARVRVRIGPLQLDMVARQAWLNGEPLSLTGKEFALLRTLASDPARVFTRDELLETVWGYASPAPSRTVDSHVCRLRRKLAAPGVELVINVWGVGYRLLDATQG